MPPAPIIYTINNVDPVHGSISGIFTLIDYLFYFEESNIHGYVEYLNYFTTEQFRLLNKRITEKRNRLVPLNQQHVIIFYATLHYTVQLLTNEKEYDLIKDVYQQEDILESEQLILAHMKGFAELNMAELKKNYKNNHSLAVAFARIDGYRIPDTGY